MLDNNTIRLKLETKFNKRWLNKAKCFDPKRNYANGNGTTYWGRLYRQEVTTENKKTLPYLEVNVAINKTETLVSISNSLRKWMGSRFSAGRDLTKDELRTCLELLAELLNIPIEELLKARLTRLEWGATLRFKEDFSGFMGCIYQHKTLKNRCQWGTNTVEFRGEDHSTIFYDKLEELRDNANLPKRISDKIKASWYFLRFEVKIDKVLSYEFSSKYMTTFHDIFLNWDIIVKWWEDELLNITFVDTMSPEIYKYLKDVGEPEFKDYITYQGIKSIGIQNIKNLVEKRYPANKRGRGHDHIFKINDKFRALDKRSYKNIFTEAVRTKAEEMRIVKSTKME